MEADDFPAGGGEAIFEAVVDAVGAALPELNGDGGDSVAAPPIGLGDFAISEFLDKLVEFGFKNGAGGDDFALLADPRADAATEWAAEEVSEGFGGGDFFGFAADDDLSFEVEPREEEGDIGILGNVVGFAAMVVGEEDEAALVEGFEEDGAGEDEAGGIGSGEDHGVGLDDVGGAGFVEPASEEDERGRREVFAAESSATVVAAHGGQRIGVGLGEG